MGNSYTDMMVHPGRPDFQLDLKRITYKSAQLDIPVEVNNSSILRLSVFAEPVRTMVSLNQLCSIPPTFSGRIFMFHPD